MKNKRPFAVWIKKEGTKYASPIIVQERTKDEAAQHVRRKINPGDEICDVMRDWERIELRGPSGNKVER